MNVRVLCWIMSCFLFVSERVKDLHTHVSCFMFAIGETGISLRYLTLPYPTLLYFTLGCGMPSSGSGP